MASSRSEIFIRLSVELLRLGYRVRFRPKGTSMHPAIRDGETITVEPVSPADVKRGDIIFCRTDDALIAHRVVSIKGRTSFVLRGDALQSCDEPVSAAQVLGRVVSVERDGRSIAVAGHRARVLRVARLFASRIKMRIC